MEILCVWESSQPKKEKMDMRVPQKAIMTIGGIWVLGTLFPAI
jgi:hypothetical protein